MPVWVALFDGEGVDGPVSRVHKLALALRHEGPVHRRAGILGDVQLPTHLAHEAHPDGTDLDKMEAEVIL